MNFFDENQIAILTKLAKKRNGAYFKGITRTNLSKYANKDNKGKVIEKITYGSWRKGISYANTKEGKAQIEKSNTHPYWAEHIDKTILRNKKTGQLYVMFFCNPLTKFKTQYLINGEFVTQEEVKQVTIPSYWNQPNKGSVRTIKIENLIEIL